jgi:hypothetical protein
MVANHQGRDDGGIGCIHQRHAIRCGARHLISGNQSRRAGPVFNNEAGAGQAFIQLARDQARHDVVRPAWRETNHKAHLAQRKILRQGGRPRE